MGDRYIALDIFTIPTCEKGTCRHPARHGETACGPNRLSPSREIARCTESRIVRKQVGNAIKLFEELAGNEVAAALPV